MVSSPWPKANAKRDSSNKGSLGNFNGTDKFRSRFRSFMRSEQVFTVEVFCSCNSIVAFTTNWKFWCCCIHCLFGVNECQWLVYTHTFPFIPTWCYLIVSHTCITFLLTQCTIHTRLVTMSASLHTQTVLHSLYYSSPNTRVWFLNIWYTSLTSVHSNLEYRLAILTESFSPLRSILHNLSCWSPKQKSTSIDTQHNSMTSVALHNII